jgi:hypothetical protein
MDVRPHLVQFPASLVRASTGNTPTRILLGRPRPPLARVGDGLSLAAPGMVRAGGTEITTKLGRKVSRGYPVDLPQRASRSGTEDVKFFCRQCRGSSPIQATICIAHDSKDPCGGMKIRTSNGRKASSRSGVVTGWSPGGRNRLRILPRSQSSLCRMLTRRAGVVSGACMLGSNRRKRRKDPIWWSCASGSCDSM